MNTRTRDFGALSWSQVDAALAESVTDLPPADSAPWSWHCAAGTISLRADLPPVADPRHRELMLIGGALLLNLRLLIRGSGTFVTVRTLPDPGRPDLIAVLRPEGTARVTPADRALLRAVLHSRDRRPAPAAPVGASVVGQLQQAARVERTWLARLPGSAAAEAPAGNPDAPSPLVIGTVLDGATARLQSGQALQRVLLTASLNGVLSRVDPEPLRAPGGRAQVRRIIGGGLWPQALLRVGAPT
ncbi:hypothetical protein [Nakamurella multipartita]|uniref:Uncharacterized protein n=1 Tax=Nakamurella multipartita (strain ATCC 700099 / DSM 44233 / CIP 104796 / JCM 9543 / NBRC 105858 / Y-104) TaxID=479431 RepID=C8XI20_NAKMY|nr:hypothetical protein [Nakamurella multipartita]ACV78389.1 hypothetical protein Namu_2004 [Nakamurella multipartita DSM 44233]